jgi:hypothetical protein
MPQGASSNGENRIQGFQGPRVPGFQKSLDTEKALGKIWVHGSDLRQAQAERQIKMLRTPHERKNIISHISYITRSL